MGFDTSLGYLGVVASDHSSEPETPLSNETALDQAEWVRRLVDELARVAHEREVAILLVDRAGFPRSRMPVSSIPLTFWTEVVQASQAGVLARGVEPIAREAVRIFPHNPVFVNYLRACSSQEQLLQTAAEPAPASPRPLRVFVSCSRADLDLGHELSKHLKLLQRQRLITTWTDHEIEAGSHRDDATLQALEAADIILLLISAEYLASDSCWNKDLARALDRHRSGRTIVVPVIVKPCDWRDAPFGMLQALPRNGEPVRSSAWPSEDEAWTEVARGIRALARRELTPS